MTTAETLWQTAEGHRRAGRWDAAEAAHEALLARAPDSLVSWHFLAERATLRGEHERAEHCLRRLLSFDDSQASAWQALGTSLLHLGRPVDAIAAFKEAVAAEPGQRLPLLSLAAALHAVDATDRNAAAMARLALHGLPAEKQAALVAAAGDTASALVAHLPQDGTHETPDFSFLPVPYAAACEAARLTLEAAHRQAAGEAGAAYHLLSRALSHNPGHKRALMRAADLAFALGQAGAGLGHLRTLAALATRAPEQKSDGHAALLYRLAVLEEQVGTPDRARAAYLACLKAGRRNALAYLFAGAFFERMGDKGQAAMLYSLGEDIDGRLRGWHRDPGFAAETRQRSAAADRLVRQTLTEVQAQALKALAGTGLNAGRITRAVWRQSAVTPVIPPLPDQQPHLFYIPDLPPWRFVEREQLPWSRAFEAAFAAIRAEFAAALPEIEQQGRPYLPADMQLGGAFDAIKGSLNWTALDLYRDGQPNQAVLRHFPQLLAALSSVPLVRIGAHPFEVFFSLLKPHQHIPPHFGLSNHGITVHLPLIVPEDCRFRVGDEWRCWREGELLAFDDSFDHEARNDSDALRVVLIFEVWHPGLTADEIKAVQASFAARDTWLATRTIPEA